MRQVKGYWWPDADTECEAVVFRQVHDVDRAVARLPAERRKVCVQAGGNCGVWPVHLTKFFAEVWTVEADFENYLCLLKNMVPSMKPIWAALSDGQSGGLGMKRNPANCGSYYVDGEGRTPSIQIDELPLDACDLIVLDIEGMEPRALKGAQATLAKFKPILMLEDKGMSKRYGVKQGWTQEFPGYRFVEQAGRDVILVPA